MGTAQRLPDVAVRKLRTGKDWLSFIIQQLEKTGAAHGQGFLNAGQEAETLLAHALGLPWEALQKALKQPMPETAAAKLRHLAERRLFDKEPTAYLTGEAWLGGLHFRVDRRVIIPRSYFVEIIPEQLPLWLPDATKVLRVADACTGSGCLAVLLAKQFLAATIDATDLSADALEVAQLNVADHGLSERIHLHHTDTLKGLKAPYDLIVCNPPYEPTALLKGLPAEFHKEPSLALVSGKDGLDVIRKLLKQASKLLAPHGILVVEIGGLHDAIMKTWPHLEVTWLPTADGSDCVFLVSGATLRRGLTKRATPAKPRVRLGLPSTKAGKGRAR
jgi:ribosomal protein L3 glutamine methyltransferase